MSGPGEASPSEAYAEVHAPESDPHARDFMGAAGDTIALVPPNTFDSSIGSSTSSPTVSPRESDDSHPSSVDISHSAIEDTEDVPVDAVQDTDVEEEDATEESTVDAVEDADVEDDDATEESTVDGALYAFKTNEDLYAHFAEIGTNNADSETCVLGKFDEGEGYTAVAEALEVTYFSLSPKTWDEIKLKLGKDALWEVNLVFLKSQLDAGKAIFLSHDPDHATGYFADEVAYLDRLGYEFDRYGDMWEAIKL